jgi:hypothetical protein
MSRHVNMLLKFSCYHHERSALHLSYCVTDYGSLQSLTLIK